MIPALALAAAIAGMEPSASPLRVTSPAALLQDACVGTGMQRTAFEQLGGARGWRLGRTTSAPAAPGWSVAFFVADGLVIMSSIPAAPGEPAQNGVACTVMIKHAAGDWRREIADAAGSLGMVGGSTDPLPGADEMLVWSKGTAETLTATFARAASHTVSITYVRRAEPARTPAISPAGNL